MPYNLIVIFKHPFKAGGQVYIPELGPSERGFTEGPKERTGVGIGTPIGCSVGDADGFVEI